MPEKYLSETNIATIPGVQGQEHELVSCAQAKLTPSLVQAMLLPQARHISATDPGKVDRKAACSATWWLYGDLPGHPARSPQPSEATYSFPHLLSIAHLSRCRGPTSEEKLKQAKKKTIPFQIKQCTHFLCHVAVTKPRVKIGQKKLGT